MKNLMLQIANTVRDIIINDSFPNRVLPPYLSKAISRYPLMGGKYLRPTLLYFANGLFNGDQKKLAYYASAIEIWHNWTLVHDDIIDGDATRRGEATCHCFLANEAKEQFLLNDQKSMRYGKDMAILCGDLQQAWAIDLMIKGQKLYKTDANLILDVIQHVENYGGVDLISGEALDVEFSITALDKISEQSVIKMLNLKTGALFRCATEIGAALAFGTFDKPEVKAIGEFACKLGEAFQLQDDLLSIFGDFSKLGKDIGSDIRERKPTVLLLHTMQNISHSEREVLKEFIGKAELTQGEIEATREIMRSSGSYDYVKNMAEKMTKEAKEMLLKFPQNEYRDKIEELLNFLTSREV